MRQKYFLRGLGIGILVTASVLTISHKKQGELSDYEIRERAEAMGMVMQEDQDLNGNLAESPSPSAAPKETLDVSSSREPDNPVKTEESKESEGSGKADASKEADNSGKADASKEADNSGKADASKETDALKEPESSGEPKVSVEPENSEEPKASREPEVSKEPSDSAGKPANTTTPKAAKEPESTKAPVAKKSKAGKKVTIRIERGMWSDAVARAMENAGLVEDAEDFDKYLCEQGYSSLISTGTYRIPEGSTYYEIAHLITK